MIRLIAAIDKSRGIADEHGIPWQGKIPTDTRYFREQTAEGTIVMGYGTYVEYDRPLHDRRILWCHVPERHRSDLDSSPSQISIRFFARTHTRLCG
jgi:dihydrofolate reductase